MEFVESFALECMATMVSVSTPAVEMCEINL
jgi:hypothetical protein